MTDAIDFFKTAMSDTQSTIRAIDSKMSFLSAAILFPIIGWDKMVEVCYFCASNKLIYWAYYGLLVSVVSAWVAALFNALRCLNSTINPEEYMPEHFRRGRLKAFYRGGANPINLLLPLPPGFISKLQWVDPESITPDVLANEYQFEHAKLCLIRDLKISRQRRAYASFGAAIIGFLLIVLIRTIVLSTSC